MFGLLEWFYGKSEVWVSLLIVAQTILLINFILGAFPYKELSNDQVIAFVLQGKRLERPESCTDQLYELMLRCWQTCPENRPQFADISRQLDVDNAKLYVDFGEPLSECDISTQSTENV